MENKKLIKKLEKKSLIIDILVFGNLILFIIMIVLCSFGITYNLFGKNQYLFGFIHFIITFIVIMLYDNNKINNEISLLKNEKAIKSEINEE